MARSTKAKKEAAPTEAEKLLTTGWAIEVLATGDNPAEVEQALKWLRYRVQRKLDDTYQEGFNSGFRHAQGENLE